MMHIVAVAGLVYRAKGNAEIEKLLRRIDSDCLVGTASYTDPETGGHFWYPKMSGAKRVEDGWHVHKKAAWTTSSGYADWYISQTTSPDFDGNYGNLSVFLFYKDEVKGSAGKWDAMGMHGNQSGPVEIDTVIPLDRIVGWPGDGAMSNDEAIDPLAMPDLCRTRITGIGACIDVAKKHVTRKAHVHTDVASRTIRQSRTPSAVRSWMVKPRGFMPIPLQRHGPTRPGGGRWDMYYEDPKVMPRARFSLWCFKAKFLSTRFSFEVSDKMLQACGGRGYMRDLELERLVRDSKAGWIMAPSNEVTAQLVGKWGLFGSEAIDWWNQKVDEPVLMNELRKTRRGGQEAHHREAFNGPSDKKGCRRMMMAVQDWVTPDDPVDLRQALGCFATGITIITGKPRLRGTRFGLTASSFQPVSLTPPLVLYSIRKGAASIGLVKDSGSFCVNVLRHDHAELAKRFAAPVADRFEGPRMVQRMPRLSGAAGCDRELRVPSMGDIRRRRSRDRRWEVAKLRRARDGNPLVYFRGEFHPIVPAAPRSA